MDIYQLDYILHEPEESHGWMYRAEIPELQGCRSWGDNPAETLEELREVARNMIQLRRENGATGDTSPGTPQGQPDRDRVTYRQLRRKLERLGCSFERQGAGSHEIWLNPANLQRTTIPRHANHDLATETLHDIRREPGISRSEFDRA